MQPHDQVTGPPARHAMDGPDRPFVYDPRQKRPVPVVKPRPALVLPSAAWNRRGNNFPFDTTTITTRGKNALMYDQFTVMRAVPASAERATSRCPCRYMNAVFPFLVLDQSMMCSLASH
jgi:hypothetical protein